MGADPVVESSELLEFDSVDYKADWVSLRVSDGVWPLVQGIRRLR